MQTGIVLPRPRDVAGLLATANASALGRGLFWIPTILLPFWLFQLKLNSSWIVQIDNSGAFILC